MFFPGGGIPEPAILTRERIKKGEIDGLQEGATCGTSHRRHYLYARIKLYERLMAKQKATEPPAIIEVQRDAKGRIFSPIRDNWLIATPEELVRQTYVCALVNEYGYTLAQMAEELSPPGVRGKGNARADIAIWRTLGEKSDGDNPLIIVECKADNVTIDQATYDQGGNYANFCKAPFFVAHNNRQTKCYRVDHKKLSPNWTEIKDIPLAEASDKEIQELLNSLKTFRENEFADLLHKCHNIIRNREHLDPAAAFDEIAKILFVKTYTERSMRERGERRNLFTVEVLQKQFAKDPINALFDATKEAYRTDRIFDRDEHINLRPATVEAIVKELQAYNLSDTGEDIKGIAFEKFLGRTFRGEIGQFFTPRSIVEFMVHMVEPTETDMICDPASGSGGFLIRFFELIRERIAQEVDAEYKAYEQKLNAQLLTDEKRAALLLKKYIELQVELDPNGGPTEERPEGGRVYQLANNRIFGTDANDRMARTSKMNMIMHGDGHGGVHHHNGFLDVNGIFPGRFNIVLTNPPFGANVEPTDKVQKDQVLVGAETYERYQKKYGKLYTDAHKALQAAAEKGSPIASLFDLPFVNNPKLGKIKTELLFMERCLDLLSDEGADGRGGRLGIVLPEGIFNNPSLQYLRMFIEDRAKLLAVVSLPQETFTSSGASVKASILFLEKYNKEDKARFDETKASAWDEIERRLLPERTAKVNDLQGQIQDAKANKDIERQKVLKKELKRFESEMDARLRAESRALLKERWDYPVFFYEAEHVGIAATGDTSVPNELLPNANQPLGYAATCLQLYQEFKKDPSSFFVDGPVVA